MLTMEVTTVRAPRIPLCLACVCIAITLTACGGVAGYYAASKNAVVGSIDPNSLRHPLLYAGGDQSSYVFRFPEGTLVTTLPQSALGVCSDSDGDVFLTQAKRVLEYRHGGTRPIAAYAVAGAAYSCSVDPMSGNLATIVYCISQCAGDEVVVFHSSGQPVTYSIGHATRLTGCAWDDRGNLFVDGYKRERFGLWELAAGTTTFEEIQLNAAIQNGAQMQWDGSDLAVQTDLNPVIYRVAIQGRYGVIDGTTMLRRVGGRAAQAGIGYGKVAVPTGPGDKRAVDIRIWEYPRGGRPIESIEHFIGPGHQSIDGVTFSSPPPS